MGVSRVVRGEYWCRIKGGNTLSNILWYVVNGLLVIQNASRICSLHFGFASLPHSTRISCKIILPAGRPF